VTAAQQSLSLFVFSAARESLGTRAAMHRSEVKGYRAMTLIAILTSIAAEEGGGGACFLLW